MQISTKHIRAKISNPILLLIILLFGFTSVACGDTPVDSLNKDSSRYLSFYETVDGERIHWEVNFFGDEITSIYKNGKRIPDDLADDYKHKVYDQLDEMRSGDREFNFHMPLVVGENFHFDSEEFEKEMEELKKEHEENKSHIYKFKFDEKEFKEQMEKLQKELKENLPKLKKFKFEFDIEEEETEV